MNSNNVLTGPVTLFYERTDKIVKEELKKSAYYNFSSINRKKRLVYFFLSVFDGLSLYGSHSKRITQ
jgi:hypothetical protein